MILTAGATASPVGSTAPPGLAGWSQGSHTSRVRWAAVTSPPMKTAATSGFTNRSLPMDASSRGQGQRPMAHEHGAGNRAGYSPHPDEQPVRPCANSRAEVVPSQDDG